MYGRGEKEPVMSDTVDQPAGQKDRSPAYPIVPLETALERLVAFDAHFKRSPARPEKVGDAWGIKAKAYGDRTAAALRYFGLLDYQGSGKGRLVMISDMGRKYLRAQQEETKQEVIKTAALRPRQIAKFWEKWGADRPADAACLDELVLDNGFSEAGARDFLKVYDATIRFAKLTDSDKPQLPDSLLDPEEEDELEADAAELPARPKPPPKSRNPPKPGMKEDVFTLKEGDVVLQWPERISPESYQDLEDWTKIILRKIKRSTVDLEEKWRRDSEVDARSDMERQTKKEEDLA